MEGLLLAARAAGVTDERVLDAIRDTPREAYVPSTVADIADFDRPLPLPHGQVTTQPSLTAVMIAGLSLGGGERVLEIGTGYGYQAALLARLAASVISIEIWPDVADQARRNLASQGLVNVTVVAGDGTQGHPPGAPWDAIIVSAAFPRVPPPLIAELKVGGRLVQPIGPGGDEDVVLFERSVDGLRRVRVLSAARFVQLRGRYGMPSLPVLLMLEPLRRLFATPCLHCPCLDVGQPEPRGAQPPRDAGSAVACRLSQAGAPQTAAAHRTCRHSRRYTGCCPRTAASR